SNLPISLELSLSHLVIHGETWRHRHPRIRHLREAGAFAAEEILHLPVAVRFAAAEEVDALPGPGLGSLGFRRFLRDPQGCRSFGHSVQTPLVTFGNEVLTPITFFTKARRSTKIPARRSRNQSSRCRRPVVETATAWAPRGGGGS